MVNNEEHWKKMYETHAEYQGSYDINGQKKIKWDEYSEYGKEYKVTLMQYNEANKRGEKQ